jgi:hypothetical protein
MDPVYFETQFECAEESTDWPEEFAIIAAYAMTGENWPETKNQAADKQLETELRKKGLLVRRVTGFSPATGHREPGWAAALDVEAACEIGLRFKQDAIYYVAGDTLGVSFCDSRRALVEIGSFRECLHFAGSLKYVHWIKAESAKRLPTKKPSKERNV